MESELTSNNFTKFLAWEDRSRDTIDVKTIYIDIAEGDHVAGILLSQIIYWHLPSANGRSKLRVKRDGHMWIAKGRADWYEETRITERQFDRAVKILESTGIVVKETFKFAGVPKVHVRLVKQAFLDAWEKHSQPLEEKPPRKSTLPNGEVQIQRLLEDKVISQEEITMSSRPTYDDTPECSKCGADNPVSTTYDQSGRCPWCLILDGWEYFMCGDGNKPVPKRTGTDTSNKLRKKAEARWKDKDFRQRWSLVLERCSMSGHLYASSWFSLEYFLRDDSKWRDLGGENLDVGKFDSFDKQSYPDKFASIMRWLVARKAGMPAASSASGWTQI